MKGLTIGKFDRRVTFLKSTEKTNEFNTGEKVWSVLDTSPTVWTNFVDRSGREVRAADQVMESRYSSCYIRYRTDLNVTMRAVFNGQVYEIISISEPPSYRKQMLEISVQLIPELFWP